MKRLPIVIMMVVAGSFLAFKTMGTGTRNTSVNPPSKYEQILKLVGSMLSEAHFSPQDINDAFSKKVFIKFMADLDPDKNMYLQSDMNALKKFETKIDDEIKGSPVEFFLEAGKIFNKRMEEVSVIYNSILAQPFEFNTDEEVTLDPDKLTYTTTDAERRDRWRKKLKYMTLERYVDLLDTRKRIRVKKGLL